MPYASIEKLKEVQADFEKRSMKGPDLIVDKLEHDANEINHNVW